MPKGIRGSGKRGNPLLREQGLREFEKKFEKEQQKEQQAEKEMLAQMQSEITAVPKQESEEGMAVEDTKTNGIKEIDGVNCVAPDVELGDAPPTYSPPAPQAPIEVNEIDLLKRQISELEGQLKVAREDQGIATGRFSILASVPDMRVELKYYYPPYKHTDKAGQEEIVSRPCRSYIAAASQGRDHGIDPRFPGEKYPEMLWEYPVNPNTGVAEPISFRYLADIERRFKIMGVVLWDRTKETKQQAQVRGLEEYRKYCLELKRTINVRHINMRERLGTGVVIPEEQMWESYYPMQSEHFRRLPGVVSEIKKLNKFVGQ